MKRVYLAIGSLALVALLGITLVGRAGVDAQDTATPDTSGTPAAGGSTETGKESAKDTYLATLAEKLGITTDELQTAIDATNDELGVDGGFGGGMGGHGDMHRGGGNRAPGWGGNNGPGNSGSQQGGMGGPADGGPSRGGSFLRDIDLADAATFLGISEDELTTQLQSGETFLDIATAQGKTDDEVRAFLIQQATNAIDERLQDAADSSAESTAPEEATDVPAQPANTAVPTVTPTVTA